MSSAYQIGMPNLYCLIIAVNNEKQFYPAYSKIKGMMNLIGITVLEIFNKIYFDAKQNEIRWKDLGLNEV